MLKKLYRVIKYLWNKYVYYNDNTIGVFVFLCFSYLIYMIATPILFVRWFFTAILDLDFSYKRFWQEFIFEFPNRKFPPLPKHILYEKRSSSCYNDESNSYEIERLRLMAKDIHLNRSDAWKNAVNNLKHNFRENE